MWVKIDDGFCTHPKILAAGPLAALLQIRAICFASQHQTDGIIPRSALGLLTHDFSSIALDDHQCQADEMDWSRIMLERGLWDLHDGGFAIHDYLEWNLSKKDLENFKEQKSKAGKKGMKARWTQAKRIITDDITPVITPVITKPYHAISISTSSFSDSEFEQFWTQYPRKAGKKAAWKAWKAAKDKPDLARILAALERAKQSPDWTKDHGKFIPHPATWLNQGRWDDEVPVHTPTATPSYRPTKVVL